MSKYQALTEALKAGPTAGHWMVSTDLHPYKTATGGGHHIERRIFTTWENPQLKGPMGVVNIAVGLGVDSPRAFCAIDEKDAAYIAAANPATISALLADLEAAKAALGDAATSLETISRLAGKATCPNGDDTCMGSFPEVRGYATSRAGVARAALAQMAKGE